MAGSEGTQMLVDRNGLGVLGLIFGGVTAAVIFVACTVVLGHLEGRYDLEVPAQVAAAFTKIQ
jgi:hypothetical protein